jgi:1,4-alpha-glucan branching enzyme
MASGYFCLVLHAHLPYVRHPEYPSFFEESWLFEAITDTYVPLLRLLEGLRDDEVPARLTVSLSPPLIEMFNDRLLRERYLVHLKKLSQLGDKEIIRKHGNPQLTEVARMYRRLLYETEAWYVDRYGCDLVAAFRRLQEAGVIEVATAGATHGFLPILKTQPATVSAQLEVAAQTYRRAFGRSVPGFWLPECGYYPGVEEAVATAGGRYFFVETHAILNASARSPYGYLAPIACPNGVAAFGRDPASSRQVWSQHDGYPGDPWYRDFYRDIGFDADFDYIRPYILDGQTRIFTGFKYHRITGMTEDKAIYEPERARERADVHAADFLRRQVETVDRYASAMDRPPLIVALYDAELFGHWWFEGPQFLNYFIRKLAYDQDVVEMITPSDYLLRHRRLPQAVPSASSWGDQGYSSFWINPGNDWIYRHLHEAGRRMTMLARRHRDAPLRSLIERALNQAARSLLLAQASDWPFIMKNGTAVDYAYGRVRDHLARFHVLCDDVEAAAIDRRRLLALETMDAIFAEIDFRVFARG